MLVNLKFLVETVVDYKGDDMENLEEISDITLTKVIVVYPEDGEEVAMDITEEIIAMEKEFFSDIVKTIDEGLKNLS